MRCSVVIPCHNRSDLTRRCVASLLEQTEAPVEILLVDNGSRDDTASLDGMAPTVRVLRAPHNLGFAGGVNLGLRASGGDHVLILNNDTQAAPNLLHELRAALAGDPRIGAVAPVSNHVKGPAELAHCGASTSREDRARIVASLQAAPRVQDVTTLSGLCLLLRRSTIDQVGVLDERFGTGNFEDDDFSLRLRLHGYRLVLARRAFLHHEGHATFRNLGLDLDRELADKRQRFAAKWRTQPAGRAVLAAMAGDVVTAAVEARDAERDWPGWVDGHWHGASAALALGDPRAAIRSLHAFLAACPRHVDARLLLANALLRAGETTAGLAELEALGREPMIAMQATYRLEILGRHALANGQAATAAEHFTAAIAHSEDPRGALHNLLGACWLRTGQLDRAEPLFTIAAARGNADAHGNLGICQHRRGDQAGARGSFRLASELAPHDAALRANYELACANDSGAD